ncbi:30242_t:CDS:2, partial [Gigaspora margarita]
DSRLKIADFGFVQSLKEFNKSDEGTYGIFPYIYPEILNGHEYTQAADFGMIMIEIATGILPFNNHPHNIELALKICEDEERLKIRKEFEEADKLIPKFAATAYPDSHPKL